MQTLNEEIITCRRCPRLTRHCEEVARTRRRAYRDQEYWGKPVPSFGDPNAYVLILGLAPGAHGANRTGRVFTGDKSGEFLYRALYETGFASQPTSTDGKDGLTLTGAWITCSAHCAPPDNKPLPEEIRNCRPFFERELELLPNLRTVVALGQIAFQVFLSVMRDQGVVKTARGLVFGHNVRYEIAPGRLEVVASYHPSQQNTSTGRLTAAMLREVFEGVRGANYPSLHGHSRIAKNSQTC